LRSGLRKAILAVKDPKKAIVIDLADERYNQLIVEVEDPSRAVQEIQGMI
jgi:hypothetical protein